MPSIACRLGLQADRRSDQCAARANVVLNPSTNVIARQTKAIRLVERVGEVVRTERHRQLRLTNVVS